MSDILDNHHIWDLRRDLHDLEQEYRRLLAKTASVWQPTLVSYINTMMNEFPSIECIWWLQYTPYFNDGSECKFQIHTIHLEDENGEEIDFPGKLLDAYYEIESLLTDDPKLMLLSFGDHCRVSFNKGDEEFTIENYNHE